ncbi:hypothetical protein DEFR109230_07790 [Deinococcus frigens]
MFYQLTLFSEMDLHCQMINRDGCARPKLTEDVEDLVLGITLSLHPPSSVLLNLQSDGTGNQGGGHLLNPLATDTSQPWFQD